MTIAILDLFGSSGGVGRCTKEILRQFDSEGITTVLCGQSHIVDSFRTPELTASTLRLANLEKPRFSMRSLKIKIAAKNKNSSRLANVLVQETSRAAAAMNGRGQPPILVNYPQVITPPGGDTPIHLFLHDLNWRFYPGNFQEPTLTDQHCRGWVERAVKVITNSECTRDEVIEHYGCSPDKVVAAPLAPFGGKGAKAGDSSKYLASLGLVANRFYLYPGVWGLHKGFDVLTGALERSQTTGPVVVTCGMPGSGMNSVPDVIAALRNSLATRWDALVAKRKLVVVSGVPEAGMHALRTNCRAYVVPSLYEGFGFPVVEAIFNCRPVIVSDIKAHREILNRYPQYKLARIVSSGSAPALAAELDREFEEPAPMPDGWQKGIETTWSWKHMTQKIISAMTA